MLFMSVKDSTSIQFNFWALPEQIKIENYINAFSGVIKPIFNSLLIGALSIAGIVILSSLAGYSFGRYDFPNKDLCYFAIIAVMMIPGILMMVPQFLVIVKLHLLNSYWGLILPYIAGMQIFGILISRSFFASIPNEMFEAARIEGAGELYALLKIALPISTPIMITIGITSLISVYNDYVWPRLILSGEEKKTFCMAVVTLSTGRGGNVDYGLTCAGYVLGSIPMFIITRLCLKQFLYGMLEGAIKA